MESAAFEAHMQRLQQRIDYLNERIEAAESHGVAAEEMSEVLEHRDTILARYEELSAAATDADVDTVTMIEHLDENLENFDARYAALAANHNISYGQLR